MFIVYLIILASAVPNHPWFGDQVGGITVIKLLGIVAIVYAAGYAAWRGSFPNVLREWPARLYVILFTWAIVSYVFVSSGSVASAAKGVLTVYVSCFFLFVIMQLTIDSAARIQNSVLALVGAIVLASLYSLREWQGAGFSAYRPGYVSGDANYFSATALLIMPIAYHLTASAKTRLERYFYLGSVIVTFVAFVVSGSRGGFVGLCAVGALTLLRSRRKLRVLAVGMLIVLPMLLYAPMSPVKRIIAPDSGDKLSTEAHQATWRFGLQMALEHPIVGIGVGEFWSATSKNNVLNDNIGSLAHNTFIEVAAELGLLGLAMLLGILVSTWRLLGKLLRQARCAGDKYNADLCCGLQEGLVGFAAASCFISTEYVKPFWIVVYIAVALCAHLRTEEQQRMKLEHPAMLSAGVRRGPMRRSS